MALSFQGLKAQVSLEAINELVFEAILKNDTQDLKPLMVNAEEMIRIMHWPKTDSSLEIANRINSKRQREVLKNVLEIQSAFPKSVNSIEYLGFEKDEAGLTKCKIEYAVNFSKATDPRFFYVEYVNFGEYKILNISNEKNKAKNEVAKDEAVLEEAIYLVGDDTLKHVLAVDSLNEIARELILTQFSQNCAIILHGSYLDKNNTLLYKYIVIDPIAKESEMVVVEPLNSKLKVITEN
jgi:hypothetical protein